MLPCQLGVASTEAESKETHIGPYAVVDYNLTLCRRQSRLQHFCQGQPYAGVDLNPMPESTLSPIWPQQYLWTTLFKVQKRRHFILLIVFET